MNFTIPNFLYKKDTRVGNHFCEIEKYAQIGKISTGLLHDIMNPITAFNLQLEMLEGKKINSAEYLNSIKKITKNVNDYVSIIKEYINEDKIEKEFELTEIIQKSIELVSHKAISNSVQIQFIRNNQYFIKNNPLYFYQVIINLVANAIDAYKEMEELSNKKVIIKILENNKTIRITIKDFGSGIDPSNMKKIFHPFYTTKQKKGGTGIGLCTTKYIIENKFKGKIFVESEPRSGSLFHIVLKKSRMKIKD